MLLAAPGFAFSVNDSTAADVYDTERKMLLQKINYEKSRIANEYKGADDRLFNLTDSVLLFIDEQKVTKSHRNELIHRLYYFLAGMNRYNTESLLKNGTYLAVLSYYPIMIEWSMKEELLRNLKRYANFSIKAVRLIPNDTIAEEFLMDYLKDHPDETFRYTEEFEDRKFAVSILEKALRLAPESAKRYFNSTNAVSKLLLGSRDLYVKKCYEIYSRFGIRSRAYLLLDDIVQNGLSLEAADSLGNSPDKMFARVVALSVKYEANVTYSIYRYMDIYCIDAMRKINNDALSGGSVQNSVATRTPEEMFVMIGYGFKETTIKTLQLLFDELRKKATGIPVSSVMVASMDKTKLKELVIYADKNQLLDKLLTLVDDEKKDYLLALTTLEEKTDLFPPFKTFIRESPATKNEPEDKVLNEIAKAKPTQPVAADTIAETDMPSQIDKPLVVKKNVPNADVAPIPAQEPEPAIEPVSIQIDERTKKIMSLKKNILQTLQNISAFTETDYAEDILLYAAEIEPDELFKKIEQFKNKRNALKILETCAINAPVSVKRYLYNPQHPVNYILSYSKNEDVLKILHINSQMGYHSKPFLLIDDLLTNKITVAQAVETAKEPRQLFAAIVKIISRPSYKGAYSIHRELRDYSLRFIREINDKIASGSNQPFYAVEGFSSAELYFLMLYGRDEVFTSTFNGLFKRFISKLPSDNTETFLQSVSYNQFRDFLSLCANFGVLEELLSKTSDSNRSALLVKYISNLELQQDNITSVVLLAEGISNLKDDRILIAIQQLVKKEFERVTNAENNVGISVYGILASIISANAKTEVAWFKKVSRQFAVAPVNNMASNTLFLQGVCVEQMYFYNDDDGRSSFTNFMNTYRSQSAWAIEDKYNFVRIYSTQGLQVEILANKPEYDENGINAINTYLKEKNMKPTVIVHRGHSFHTESTLEKVPASAKLVFVGSCGGFYKIALALSNSPNAHIISTKQVGTKTVNDAMLLALNENIRQGKDIIWNEFWDKMREKLGNNQYFSDYIPPHKNMESIFIKAYYSILGV